MAGLQTTYGAYSKDGGMRVINVGDDVATQAWTIPALVACVNGAAVDILAAGVAFKSLIIINEHATEAVRIRFDGSDATSVRGISLAGGKGITFAAGEVPSGKISAYAAANTPNIFSAYIA